MRAPADCMWRHAEKSVRPRGGLTCRTGKSDHYMTGWGATADCTNREIVDKEGPMVHGRRPGEDRGTGNVNHNRLMSS